MKNYFQSQDFTNEENSESQTFVHNTFLNCGRTDQTTGELVAGRHPGPTWSKWAPFSSRTAAVGGECLMHWLSHESSGDMED